MSRRRDDTITLQRLEAALALVSFAILEDGPVYAPIFDRLEREIAAVRSRDDTVSKARRFLQSRADAPLALTAGAY